jgi:glutamyl-tRNA reductase
MNILVVGLNHKTASIDWREKVAFSREDIDQALPLLANHPEIKEAVIVSTCNRVELYCVGAFEGTVRDWLFKHKNIECPQAFAERCYVYENIQAVEHLMRVACGLDSLVLGEPEILGQVKAGYTQACLHKTVGKQLGRLFQQVFRIAKQVRTSTSIGACPVSVASISAMTIKSWAKNMSAMRVLVIGSGDTSRLAALHVAKLSPKIITITGRNSEKVKALAQEINGLIGELTDLPLLLSQHDIIISATANPNAFINAAMFSSSHPQLLVDLAVPRDIDANVAELPHITLYCIDDLKLKIADHGEMRVHAAQKAENLIAQYAREFMLSLRDADADEVIKHYRATLEKQCQIHLQKALSQLKQGENAESVLENFSHSLMNQVMHEPSIQIRRASSEGRADIVDLAYELFGMASSYR